MPTGSIDDTAIISRKPGLVGADVADEAILLDIDSGYFFQLNVTAAKLWTMVEMPQSFGVVCAEMGRGYAIDAATCRNDVAEFVADLAQRGLIEIATG